MWSWQQNNNGVTESTSFGAGPKAEVSGKGSPSRVGVITTTRSQSFKPLIAPRWQLWRSCSWSATSDVSLPLPSPSGPIARRASRGGRSEHMSQGSIKKKVMYYNVPIKQTTTPYRAWWEAASQTVVLWLLIHKWYAETMTIKCFFEM